MHAVVALLRGVEEMLLVLFEDDTVDLVNMNEGREDLEMCMRSEV